VIRLDEGLREDAEQVLLFAIRRGATVIGTASEANHKYLIALGAVPTTYVVNYGLVIHISAWPGGCPGG
jgi:hypothetical protein